MALHGQGGVLNPRADKPGQPKPGFHRVQMLKHYKGFMTNDVTILTHEEVEIEMKRTAAKRRFKVIAKGKPREKTEFDGDPNRRGLRGARVD